MDGNNIFLKPVTKIPPKVLHHAGNAGLSWRMSTNLQEEITNRFQAIKLDVRRPPVRPVPLDLAGEAGRRLVLETAKRVIATHTDVLAALACR